MLIRLDYLPFFNSNTPIKDPPYAGRKRSRGLVGARAAAAEAAASFP